MECAELREQLGDYLDDDAVADLCREIERHLKRCPSCQVYVDSVRKTIVLYQMDDQSRRLEVPVRVNARLRAALADEYARFPGETIPPD